GRVKLMDVEVTGLLGTPVPENMLDLSPAEYLAPEQIRRAPATEKTDIYAFAAIVYGMFSGAPPFMAATRDAVIAKHLSEPAPLMARRRASASAERIVMQALEKDPELSHEMLNGLWEEPNAPAVEPRVASPAAPALPARVPTEPPKAMPPAAPPLPRVAAVASGSLGSAPVSAEVQLQRRTYRVGWLDSGRVTAQYQEIVKQALVGYPRDVAFEYRSADGQTARLQALAAELVQLKVDVLFAVGNQAIQAAKQATATV